MNIKERLKAAYENVVFNADTTWINGSNEYQKANLDLFRKERQIELIKVVELRPRTVKDSIPESRLAQYSNYEYNESRELSYAPCNSSFNNFIYYSRESGNQLSKEAWLLPEVDEFFLWFTNYNIFPSQITHESSYDSIQNLAYCLSTKELPYESPILRVDSLDSRILKMQITSDRIKNIWNVNITHIFNEFSPDVNDKTLNVYKTPAGTFILAEDSKHKELLMEKELLRKSNDVKHLKYLSKMFQEQNAWALKYMASHNSKRLEKNFHANNRKIMESQATCLLEQPPTKRLYSAVLQGLTTAKIPIPPTKMDQFTTLVAASCEKCKEEPKSLTEAHHQVLENEKVNSPDITQSIPEQLTYNAAEYHHLFDQRTKNVAQKLEQIDSQHQKPSFKNPKLFKTNTNNKSCPSDKQQLDITTSPESAVAPSPTSILKNTSNYVQATTSTISMCNTLNNVNGSFTMNQSSCFNQYNYQINSYFNNNFHGSCVYSANTFSTNMSQMMVSRGVQARQGYMPGAYQMPPHPLMMVPQNRPATMYPLLQQYVHQQPYYCPVQTPRPQAQRWLQPGYTRSSVPQSSYRSPLPHQFVPSSPSQLIHPTTSGQQAYHAAEQALSKQKPSTPTARFHPTTPQPPVEIRKEQKKPGRENLPAVHSASSSETSVAEIGSERLNSLQIRGQQIPLLPSNNNDTHLDEFDEIVSKTVNLVFAGSSSRREVPSSVTPSISEELEIQALEQYSCSNDSVYRELERQAEEQYEGYSENCRSPPISRAIFGGLGSLLLRPRCGLIINL